MSNSFPAAITEERLAEIMIETDKRLRNELRQAGHSEEEINRYMQASWDGFSDTMYNGRMV